METEKAGVYSIYCKPTKKYYIGSSKNIKLRLKQHRDMLCNGTHHSIKLQNDYDKYGIDSFEFSTLLNCNYADAMKKEREFINVFHAEENGYNCTGSQLRSVVEAKENRFSKLIKKYISNTYRDDGNVYCYELWSFCNNTFGTFKEFIKWIKPDNNKSIYAGKLLADDTTCVLMNIVKEDLCITIVDSNNYDENKSEYIIVDF